MRRESGPKGPLLSFSHIHLSSSETEAIIRAGSTIDELLESKGTNCIRRRGDRFGANARGFHHRRVDLYNIIVGFPHTASKTILSAVSITTSL